MSVVWPDRISSIRLSVSGHWVAPFGSCERACAVAQLVLKTEIRGKGPGLRLGVSWKVVPRGGWGQPLAADITAGCERVCV